MKEQFTCTCTMETLEAAFGGRWGFWLSGTGRWWAARRAALTGAELADGCVPFLRADNPSQLADRIRAQEEISADAGGQFAGRPLAQP